MYFRTRLKRMWTHLERLGGGGTGGLGAGRGPGEKQLETDRRLVDRRISELKHRLHEVESRRERTVSLRRDQPTVSLVGYTNAGKSTLMRSLTGADVLVEDKLFATLDTRTRRWAIPGFGDVLLSDTVGFVRNLPHHLVASFRSTLEEEARHADLLLHVVDASSPEAERQIHTVYQVLQEIGVDCSNVLLVLNKVDRIEDQSIVDVLRRHYPTRSRSVLRPETVWTGWQQLSPNGCQAVLWKRTSKPQRVMENFLPGCRRMRGDFPDYSETGDRVLIRCRIPRPLTRNLPSETATVSIPGEPIPEPTEAGNCPDNYE